MPTSDNYKHGHGNEQGLGHDMVMDTMMRYLVILYQWILHCKAGEANTSLKTASCEAGPGTTPTDSYEIYIWSLLIQEFIDGCCYPNSNLTFQSVICTMII